MLAKCTVRAPISGYITINKVSVGNYINGAEGMMYMSSTSSDGSYSLTITFENGTDLDQAAIDVQNRMSQVTSTLPEAVTQQGVSVRKESTNTVALTRATSGPSTCMSERSGGF